MYKYYALILIFLANFLDYLDRTIISALLSNIQREYDIGEGQKGMLLSAFIVGYIIAAPIIGVFADRKHRPRLFAICAFVWSAASIGSALAHDFSQMLISRVFLGFGEAGAIVIGPSLLSDYFPSNVRGRVVAIFFLGMPLGSITGYLFAGELVKDKRKISYSHPDELGIQVSQRREGNDTEVFITHIDPNGILAKQGAKIGDIVLALGKNEVKTAEKYNSLVASEKEIRILFMEVHHGWRHALFIAGLPGILLSFLIFLLRDPPRAVHEGGHSLSLKDLSHYKKLLAKTSLFLIIIAQTVSAFVIAPIAHFGVDYLENEKQMEKEVATRTFGGIGVVAGILGNVAAGWLGDRLAIKNKGAYVLIAGVCFMLSVPFMWIGLYGDVSALVLLCIFFGFFFLFCTMTTVNTQITNIVPQSERSRAFAVTLFIMHLFGDLSSPPLFGIVADNIGRKILFMVTPILLLISGICCISASKHARKDAEQAHEANTEAEKAH